MRIGMTERGDAGLDMGWVCKLHGLDGAILITKKITNKFARAVLRDDLPCPVIIHATCTGLGGTVFEPNVPDCRVQLSGIRKLIDHGFPKERIVLRIDPIVPTTDGLAAADAVIRTAKAMGLLPGIRVRVSVFDQYKHVVARFKAAGIHLPYPEGNFYASPAQFRQVSNLLASHPDVTFETCAEKTLRGPNIVRMGCVSHKDLELMGLPTPDMPVNMQNRGGCLCLACKTELLECRHPCKNFCRYCYWRG